MERVPFNVFPVSDRYLFGGNVFEGHRHVIGDSKAGGSSSIIAVRNY